MDNSFMIISQGALYDGARRDGAQGRFCILNDPYDMKPQKPEQKMRLLFQLDGRSQILVPFTQSLRPPRSLRVRRLVMVLLKMEIQPGILLVLTMQD